MKKSTFNRKKSKKIAFQFELIDTFGEKKSNKYKSSIKKTK
jgi:hypothetical protein